MTALSDPARSGAGPELTPGPNGRQPDAGAAGGGAVGGGAQRDPQAVLGFIERFTSALIDSGVPRMPARVFTGLLATDSGRLGAAELADLLQVSPAAISGAVRYLIQVNLITRERDRTLRRDVYRVQNDVWYEIILSRGEVLARWERALHEGISAVGAGTQAGERLTDTLTFFEFLRGEIPLMQERWRAYRLARAGSASPAGSAPPEGAVPPGGAVPPPAAQ